MKFKIGLFILTKLNKMLSLSKRLNMIPYNTQLNCFFPKMVQNYSQTRQ